ncbi:hypothetical protein D9M72_416380 [compost metagenome]
MVVTAGFDLGQQASGAQLLQARVGQVQVLEGPAHLLAVHGLALAELGLRHAHRFHRHHRRGNAAVVQHRTDLVLVLHVALAGAVDDFLDIGDQRHALARDVPGRAHVALGGITRRHRVFLGARPPGADHLLAREAHLLRSLQRGLVHYAPAPEDHVVGILLADLQPLRALLVARVRHRDLDEVELVEPGLGLQRHDRLLAIGRVVVQVDDLLAGQRAAALARQVLDDGRDLHLVRGHQRERIREHRAIHGIGAAVAHHHQRHLVSGGLVDQRVRNAGGHGVVRGALGGGVLGLQAFIALHALGVVVLGLALFPRQLDAVDAAFLQVDVVEVVDETAIPGLPVGAIRPHAVAWQRHELLVALRHGRRRRRQQCRRGADHQGGALHIANQVGHDSLHRPQGSVSLCVSFRTSHRNCGNTGTPPVNEGTATASASPWRSATAGPARAAPRSGRR